MQIKLVFGYDPPTFANMQQFFLFFVFFFPCSLSSGFLENKSSEFRFLPLLPLGIFPQQQTNGDHLKCTTDDECQSLIFGSICENNMCVCPRGKLLSSDGSKCLEPGEKFGCHCEDNVQCSHLLSAGGSCIEAKCKCKPGYHYLRGLCWKNLELHHKCQRREQCFSDHEYIGLECRNRICSCRKGYYQRLESGCRKIMNKDERCNLDSDCAVGKCLDMRCSQSAAVRKSTGAPENVEVDISEASGTVKWKQQKEILAVHSAGALELGMSCTDNSQCNHIKNALCLDDQICGCIPPMYVASSSNSECLKVARGQVEDITKSTCKEDVQCGVFGGSSVCLDKKCACKNGSYWEKDAKFCWIIKSLGESCSDNRDCHPSGKNAECSHGTIKSGRVCLCQRGYHSKNDNCIPDALKVGDYCETDDECLFLHSTCDQNSNACACREHYYLENGKCVAGIGNSCAGNAECGHLPNTYCRKKSPTEGGLCSCLDKYIPSENNNYCLPAVKYEEVCLESFQCKLHLGDSGECKGGFCRCKGSAHYSRGRCYISKFLGDPCSRQQDCFAGNNENAVICLKGFCACHFDYTSDGNRTCIKANSGTRPTLHWLLLAAIPTLLRWFGV